MHMSKTFLAVGAVTVGLLAPSALAKDTAEDAQLREALREKMSALTPAPASPAPAPVAPSAPVAPAAPAAPAPMSPAPVVTSWPEAGNSSDVDALTQALRARIAQEPPVVEAPPAPVVSVAPTKVAPAKAATVKPTPKVTAASKPAGYEPLVAPPAPLTGTKAQRLQQLLEQYKADQITPAEYHAQRAQIIAE
jgi:hypothetical protein